ncbi:MAG: succinoglycan biosynthesis protein ExoA [Solirubrobacteraceae bacterium]|nr:succinoglycan biosynthesis protein ExoA [Solirubrobacteraceae bacterium]
MAPAIEHLPGIGQRPDPGPEITCSVLMPVLNEEGHIRDSVAAMRSQHFAGRLEFLVVDGGSSDRTREILRELAAADPRIRVLDNPRRIASSGLNVALCHARGRYVARMDAHTEYQENYVALGIRRLRDGDTAWVSGPPVPVGRGPVSRAVALALRSPLGRGGSRKWAAQAGEPAREYALDSGVFAGVWERETLLACGGWDEDWTVNQDSEMAGRFLLAGEQLICLTGMAAFYTPRDSLPGLWRQYLRYGEFREKTAVRHPDTLRRSHLLAPGLVSATVAALISPRPVRRAARAALVLYLGALGASAWQASTWASDPADAALVAPVLATMHYAHGVGTLRGVRRHGDPGAALDRSLGLHELAVRLRPGPVAVNAPSLGAPMSRPAEVERLAA